MIAEPYKVLGISSSATDDEIKKAYRALSKKYHPDANINDPETAEAKFKEVQEAYRQVMKAREQGDYSESFDPRGAAGNSGYGGFGGGQGGTYGDFWEQAWRSAYSGYGGSYSGSTSQEQESIEMTAARNYINAHHYQEAVHVLDSISSTERGARWYYYSALANSGMGNNVIALDHAKKAVGLDPNNREYQMLLQRMEGGGSWYESMGEGYGRSGMSMNTCCYGLCLAQMCCGVCCRPY